MRLALIAAVAIATALFAAPAGALEPNQQDEPCTPESIFDDRCDAGGGSTDRCFENCRDCARINGRFGCYAVYWAAYCSCYTEWQPNPGGVTDPILVCSARGTCSVMV